MGNVEAEEEISTEKQTSLASNESTKHLNNTGRLVFITIS